MRIISKHKDYYDSVQMYSGDDPNVYVRMEREENVSDINISNTNKDIIERILRISPSKSQITPFTIDTLVVGFCGKIYPCLKLTYQNTNHRPHEDYERIEYIYDVEHYRKFVDSLKNKKYSKHYYTKEGKRQHLPWRERIWTSDRDYSVREFFEKVKVDDRLGDLFFEFKSPIFLFQNDTIENRRLFGNSSRYKFTVNPSLSKLMFQSVAGVYQAYQEIEMYYFGVLGCTEKDLVEVSDISMRDKKGFDKMSFKKAPSKKR